MSEKALSGEASRFKISEANDSGVATITDTTNYFLPITLPESVETLRAFHALNRLAATIQSIREQTLAEVAHSLDRIAHNNKGGDHQGVSSPAALLFRISEQIAEHGAAWLDDSTERPA